MEKHTNVLGDIMWKFKDLSTWSIENLSQEIHASNSTIYHVLNGESTNLKYYLAVWLLLGESTDWVMETSPLGEVFDYALAHNQSLAIGVVDKKDEKMEMWKVFLKKEG